MSHETIDPGRIGPELALDEIAIPPHVGDRLATFYGREQRVSTAAEWTTAVVKAIHAETGRGPRPSDMCTMPDGAHTVEFDGGDEQSYVCILDPVLAVYLRGEPGTVRTITPAEGREVTIDVGRRAAVVSPSSAVWSLGVGATDCEPTLETAYRQLCAYTHAFASSKEYERWATATDAATTSLTVDAGLALAREITATFDRRE